jgi:tRNA/rRNA methyltransferase
VKLAPSVHQDVTALERVRIVLSRPSLARNIGSSARAMKTMGIRRLYLVEPKHFPDADAIALASGAADVLDSAMCCTSLDEALLQTTLSFAVSARRRDLSHATSDIREAAGRACDELAAGGEVAFVFGTEMSGLENDEVLRCSRVAFIPAHPEYSSLNLAMAVQLVTYELWMAQARPRARVDDRAALASHEELEYFYVHLEEALVSSGFLDPHQPKRLMERVRRLFGRATLERDEVNILRGMLNSFGK